MNKKAQWNIGLGTAIVIGGLFLMTREITELIILGIVLMGIGVWLITMER